MYILYTCYLEPLKYRTHHAGVKFAPGGRLLLLNPRQSVSSVEIRTVKSLITDPSVRRITDIMDRFKGSFFSFVIADKK